jgi:hypothetical protein
MRVRTLAGTFALLAGLSTVAGCGDDGKTVVTKDGDKVSVDADKGEVTVESDEGTFTAGQGLPDGFPKDDVPLLDENVVSGVKGTPDGQFAWSVVMQTSRAIDDVTAEVQKDFAAAGYTAGQSTVMGDVSILQFTDDDYEVGVTAARTGEGVMVTYVVKDAS